MEDDKMPPRSNGMTIDVEAKTRLGRRLRELRAEITKSGIAPLGWDEIETEVALRRGGWREGS